MDKVLGTEAYLSFYLDKAVYAFNVNRVTEILEMTSITQIPKAPDHLRGVINLRGNVLPIVDIRAKFDLSTVDDTINTCIIVLDVSCKEGTVNIGAVVDGVKEVIEIDDEHVKPPPSIGNSYSADHIEGMAKVGDDFLIILNSDSVFSSNELIDVSHIEDATEVV